MIFWETYSSQGEIKWARNGIAVRIVGVIQNVIVVNVEYILVKAIQVIPRGFVSCAAAKAVNILMNIPDGPLTHLKTILIMTEIGSVASSFKQQFKKLTWQTPGFIFSIDVKNNRK